ncbi:hypothetical protein CEXT_626071 [Caerostris extrusa]|uniref:Uncharacterized protein n=1 Tax=Caerostris extrusa TaxID=172846 RepID=A0AAV4XZ53_CAEEX|nr:hypothetical protein CEXT_626071 [Caerostris extrusa]
MYFLASFSIDKKKGLLSIPSFGTSTRVPTEKHPIASCKWIRPPTPKHQSLPSHTPPLQARAESPNPPTTQLDQSELNRTEKLTGACSVIELFSLSL